jgi:hypothetical protein
MTSPAKIRANRRNGRKSRGPTSRIGKLIAARNARRHGLTLPVLCDPALSREVDDLARTIETSLTGAAADELGHEYACRIAEAVFDARRVRQVKMRLVAALDADQGNGALLKRLASLDKYEGRAFSRRTTAVREFDTVMALRTRVAKTNPTEKGQ